MDPLWALRALDLDFLLSSETSGGLTTHDLVLKTFRVKLSRLRTQTQWREYNNLAVNVCIWQRRACSPLFLPSGLHTVASDTSEKPRALFFVGDPTSAKVSTLPCSALEIPGARPCCGL